jgi:hypothetical protein
MSRESGRPMEGQWKANGRPMEGQWKANGGQWKANGRPMVDNGYWTMEAAE